LKKNSMGDLWRFMSGCPTKKAELEKSQSFLGKSPKRKRLQGRRVKKKKFW